jgi:GxxExxY protein
MDTDLRFKEETEALIGCAFEVLNSLGHGFHEKPYENALAVELAHRGIPFVQQGRYPMMYRGVVVSEFVPDLTAFDKVVIDTKTIARITDQEIGQMVNYLKITGLPVGLILNFRNPKLEFRRVVPFTQNFIRKSI